MTPRLLVTLGDVAGIGPEIIAKAWPQLARYGQCTVVGDPTFLPQGIPCVNPCKINLSGVLPGVVSAAAGQAAYEWLCYAIDECLAGRAEAIVTAPIHKEGFHAAGVPYPGHTEVLADRCAAAHHAMLLYDDDIPLAVAHVTLHTSVADAVKGLSIAGVLEKIELLHELIPRLTGQPARIAVGALNPHASDGGLFGHEEATIITPAIRQARAIGLVVRGPIPADAIFLPHQRGSINGIVCMIHDHGHIPMKLLGGRRAVNVTAGLPIIRTSVAHGTAYDIVGKNIADESSLVAAVRVAASLTARTITTAAGA